MFSCSASSSADSSRSYRHAQSQHAFLIKMWNLVSLSPPYNSPSKIHLVPSFSTLIGPVPTPTRSLTLTGLLFQHHLCARLPHTVCSLGKHSCSSDPSPESPPPFLSLMCGNWTSLAGKILRPLNLSFMTINQIHRFSNETHILVLRFHQFHVNLP